MVDPVDAPPAERAAPSSPLKRYAFIGSIALATHGTLFVVGYLRGSLGATEAEKKLADARALHSAELSKSTGRLGELGAQVAKLEARRALDRGLGELEARNFGLAQSHLSTAARILAKVTAPKEVVDLAQTVGGLHLVATEDLSEQRGRLRALITTLDTHLPPWSDAAPSP